MGPIELLEKPAHFIVTQEFMSKLLFLQKDR